MFSTVKTKARDLSQRLISGHISILAFWALQHAGVLQAMTRDDIAAVGLSPREYAEESRLVPEILEALLTYLVTAGIVVYRDGRAYLTPDGRALLDHETGVLELLSSYHGALDAVEHLLVGLKVPGSVTATRKSDAAADSQHRRWLPEVYPAIEEIILKQKFTHLLDVSCGGGELLVHLAKTSNQIVGVGLGSDSPLVRKANIAFETSGLEKRLIAVNSPPLEALHDTKRVFDRIGISPQLWHEMDCILACNVLGETTGLNRESLLRTLSAIPRTFPKAHFLLAEPCAGPKFDKNYYAPELSLLLHLSRAPLWTADHWRTLLGEAKFNIKSETHLTTDGLTLFLCARE